MSKKVLFNGAILFRPGAATKVDASQFEALALTGVGICGLIGEADGGQPSIIKSFVSPEDVKAFFRSGPLVEAANLLSNPSKDPRIPGGATLIICVKVNQSTQSTLIVKQGVNNVNTHSTRDYGVHTKMTTVTITAGPTTGRIITIKDKSTGTERTEISPELGALGKMTIQYIGAAAASLATITPTSLVIANTAAVDDITIQFAATKNLSDVIALLNATGKYTAVALVAGIESFNPANLDYISAADIKTAPVTLYARNFDIEDWVNNNSGIISSVRSVGAYPIGATWPDVLVETQLAGGVRGVSTNTNWTNSFATLGTVEANQIIPLASQNGTVYGLGDTYTFDSILAALEAHCRVFSSTSGKKERQGWAGAAKSKTALITAAVATNSEHVCLSGQQPQILFVETSTVGFGEEYLYAALQAGMRAGAPLGEPLTFKYPNCSSVKVRDGSWDPDNDTDAFDLINNGINYARNVPQKGVRFDRMLTTFLKSNNDAFTEESIVQGWKNISREVRTNIEDRYTGIRGLLRNVNTIIPFVTSILELLREEGQIADSFIAGQIIPGFGDFHLTFNNDVVTLTFTVSPVSGINFLLNTVFVKPAQISLG